MGFAAILPQLRDGLLKSFDLVVHFRHVVEQGKVLVLHFDKVRDNLVQARVGSNDFLDAIESIFEKFRVFQVFGFSFSPVLFIENFFLKKCGKRRGSK